MARILTTLLGALALALGLFAPAAAREGGDDFGVLVMAHGGGAEWNASVEKMLAPVGEDYAMEIAFGMADPATIQDAVAKLEARGVDRIAVVRLFISGESWLERTEQILGMKPGAPARPMDHGTMDHSAHGGGSGMAAGHSMALWRIDSAATYALSQEGLADAPEMNAVLAERVKALSRDPKSESILILAHGPGDDGENARWIERIGARAGAVRAMGGFRAVHVATLREDWADKRALSEADLRTFVDTANKDGGRAIIVPFRVSGFGPYAKVFENQTYVADQQGLLPSAEAEHWVRRQVEELEAQLGG